MPKVAQAVGPCVKMVVGIAQSVGICVKIEVEVAQVVGSAHGLIAYVL